MDATHYIRHSTASRKFGEGIIPTRSDSSALGRDPDFQGQFASILFRVQIDLF